MLKFKTFNFDLKFYWNWSFFHYEKIMRLKKWPQLPRAGRTMAEHHHGSHTHTSPEAVLLGKMAYHTKLIPRQCSFMLFVSKQSSNYITFREFPFYCGIISGTLFSIFLISWMVEKGVMTNIVKSCDSLVRMITVS